MCVSRLTLRKRASNKEGHFFLPNKRAGPCAPSNPEKLESRCASLSYKSIFNMHCMTSKGFCLLCEVSLEVSKPVRQPLQGPSVFLKHRREWFQPSSVFARKNNQAATGHRSVFLLRDSRSHRGLSFRTTNIAGSLHCDPQVMGE